MKSATAADPRGREGIVMVIALLLLGVLGFLVLTLARNTSSELAGAGFYRHQRAALYQAHAGVHYAVARLSQDLASGAVSGSSVTHSVNYTAPSGFTFDPIRTIFGLPDGGYAVTATGHSSSAVAVVEVTAAPLNLLTQVGIFGDSALDVQPDVEVYSYDSRTTTNPVPSVSTGEATVGSNEDVGFQPRVMIDGIVALGQDLSGQTASFSAHDPAETEEMERINPDPLGAVGGGLAVGFTYYSQTSHNHNSTFSAIKNNRLEVSGNMTITSGVYYLTSLTFRSKAKLAVAATPQSPVVIFLSGPLTMQPNTDFNVTDGRPPSLFVFSNSSSELRVQPNSDFSGFLYAPYADIKLQPNGRVFGVVWGHRVDIQPQSKDTSYIFVDMSLLDRFRSRQLAITDWRQLW